MAAASVRLSVFVAVFTHLFIAIIACPLSPSTLPIPAGLQPGDHYYLLFFTAQTTGFSSDMATYNAIANDYAGQLGYASPGVTWHAFLSTTSESVVANIPTSAYPVYNISYGLPADLIASDPLSLATQGPSVPIGPGARLVVSIPRSALMFGLGSIRLISTTSRGDWGRRSLRSGMGRSRESPQSPRVAEFLIRLLPSMPFPIRSPFRCLSPRPRALLVAAPCASWESCTAGRLTLSKVRASNGSQTSRRGT